MANQQNPNPIPVAGTKNTHGEAAGFWGKLLESEMLAGLISCVLLGTGLSVALLALTEFDRGFLRCLGFALAGVVVIAAANLRWWIPLSGIGCVFLFAAGVNLQQGTFRELLDYWSGFAGWIRNGALYHETYSDSPAHGLLQFLIILAVLVAVYPLVRRPVFYPALIIASAGVVVFTYFLAPVDMTSAICACSAGIIVLLPGIYARSAEKSGGAGSRARMQLIAFPAALLAVALSLWITPEDTGSWRSRTMVNLWDDIVSLFQGPLSSRPVMESDFSLSDLGFRAGRSGLGGPARLQNHPALHIQSPVPVLMKGKVYDIYTGRDWETGGPDGDFRFESILWRSYRREALGQDRPIGGSRVRRLYNNLTKDIGVTVTYASNRYTTLFTAGKPRDLRFSQQLKNPEAFYNMRSEVYMHQRMPSRQGIQFKARIWDTSRPDFDSLFKELESLTINGDDQRYENLLIRYTALPGSLPPAVRELTGVITAGADSPYEKVAAIIAWLNENSEYSLEPDIIPGDEDFVDYFLKTNVGYCTYYASALAVMARCEGIPSRYVTGFALEESGDGGIPYVATGETAHAWTEIYFKGIGWVEFDPLSWDAANPLNRGESAEIEAVPVQPQIPVQEPYREIPNESHDLEYVLEENTRQSSPWSFFAIPAILAAIIVLPRLGIRILLGRKGRQFALNRICSRESDHFRRLDIYYKDILRQLKLLRLEPQPGETLVTFPARVDKRIRVEATNFASVAKSISDYHFAEIKPRQIHVEEACRYHQLLEGLLLDNLGKWAYLAKRAVR